MIAAAASTDASGIGNAAMVDREDCDEERAVIERVDDPVVAAVGTVLALEFEAKHVTANQIA